MNRYSITSQRERLYYGTSASARIIKRLIKNKTLKVKELALRDGERLDHVAHRFYGDGRLWWIIAAASDIGWGLQCPPGTFLRIPMDLGVISKSI
jgi:hypothetical protein